MIFYTWHFRKLLDWDVTLKRLILLNTNYYILRFNNLCLPSSYDSQSFSCTKHWLAMLLSLNNGHTFKQPIEQKGPQWSGTPRWPSCSTLFPHFLVNIIQGYISVYVIICITQTHSYARCPLDVLQIHTHYCNLHIQNFFIYKLRKFSWEV